MISVYDSLKFYYYVTNLITTLISSMTKLLDADWLDAVYFINCAAGQLMIFQN